MKLSHVNKIHHMTSDHMDENNKRDNDFDENFQFDQIDMDEKVHTE
jgi:hypothetical protein